MSQCEPTPFHNSSATQLGQHSTYLGDVCVKPKFPQGSMMVRHKAMGQAEVVSHGGDVAYTYALWSPHPLQVGATLNTWVCLQFTLISLKACMVGLGKKHAQGETHVGRWW